VARRTRRPVLSGRAGAWLVLAGLLVGSGPPAPLGLSTLEGEPVALAPSAGRPLVVHFWATWCPSCALELPALSAARSACERSVEIAVVNVDEEVEEIRRFLAEHAPGLGSLRDPGGRAWRASVGARGLPANLVWTPDGERRSELGPFSREQWRTLFAELGCKGTLPEP
jgi:thiol-disulfide isomerase/thioredoxin